MKFIWLFLFSSFYLFGQSDNDYFLISKIKVGMTFDGHGYFRFSDMSGVTASRLEQSSLFPIYPGFSVGVGLEGPIIIKFYETNLSLALELSYGQATTGEINTYTGKSKFTSTSLPILLWTSIKTTGKIIPFLRVGVGAERTEMIEKHFLSSRFDFDIKEWFFCWGAGAGIDINISSYTVSLFVDAIIKEHGMNNIVIDGSELNADYRNAMFFGGIQFGYPL